MMNTRWIRHFADALPDAEGGAEILGGKGYSLYRMTQAGWPVPPGFTIVTACCRAYYESERQLPNDLKPELREAVARIERETGRSFGAVTDPLVVAVRSGAPVSMPGMMDTILNCGLTLEACRESGTQKRWADFDQLVRLYARSACGLDGTRLPPPDPREDSCISLLDAFEKEAGEPFPVEPWDMLEACISAVFNSWNSERAVAFRNAQGIPDSSGTAVNVQAMLPAEVAGIVFTRNPASPADEVMLIEASPGLGERVVSGSVTPSRFVAERSGGTIVESTLTDEPLPPEFTAAIPELVSVATEVESMTGVPMDIEFGWAKGRLALLQSRPIRSLGAGAESENYRLAEIERLRSLADEKRIVWIEHNLSETLKHPTPLTWSIVREFMSGSGGFGQLYRLLGYRPSAEVNRTGFLELILGRIYADPQRAAQLFFSRLPMRYSLDALSENPERINHPPDVFDADAMDASALPGSLADVWALVGATRRIRRLRTTALDRFDRCAGEFRAAVSAWQQMDLTSLAPAELLTELEQRRTAVLNDFAPESLLPGFLGGLACGRMNHQLELVLGPDEAPRVAARLLQALEGDSTFEQNEALYRWAVGEDTIEDFLSAYGHRAVDEMELSTPRWRENPEWLEQSLASYRDGRVVPPHERHDQNRERRVAAEKELETLFAERGALTLLPDLRRDLAESQALLPCRERGKNLLMLGYAEIRSGIEELARKLKLGDGVYFLEMDELSRAIDDTASLESVIKDRRTQHAGYRRMYKPAIVDSSRLDSLGKPEPVTGAQVFNAEPVSGGVVTGTARVIHSPDEAGLLPDDAILVCPSTDPGWAPLFLRVSGLVFERGGILSHGAILARDTGIPAAVLTSATRLIPDGSRIRLSADTGEIAIIDESGETD